MKKKILLILSIAFLPGCTINYDLSFDDNEIRENISGNVLKEKAKINEFDTGLNLYYSLVHFDQLALTDSDDVYTKNITENNEYYDYTAEYTYKSIDDLKKSRIINSCFKKSDILDTEDYLSVSLGDEFYCLYTDKVNVSIRSNYAVISSNADKIKDNTYTWVLDSIDDDIEIIISKDTKYEDQKKKSSSFKTVWFIILMVLGAITYLLYKKKNSTDTF